MIGHILAAHDHTEIIEQPLTAQDDLNAVPELGGDNSRRQVFGVQMHRFHDLREDKRVFDYDLVGVLDEGARKLRAPLRAIRARQLSEHLRKGQSDSPTDVRLGRRRQPASEISSRRKVSSVRLMGTS